MNQQQIDRYIRLIRSETAPAMGCTEPAAGALCAAAAAAQLGCAPESLAVEVSSYIFKNAMNVGIPGTGETGHRLRDGRPLPETRAGAVGAGGI